MAVIPGRFLPSRNSKKAPPAVETKLKEFNKLYLFIAATVFSTTHNRKNIIILSFF